ncbi:MAG: UbiA-like polyprenyltransferase [Desulfohalobiaceae bacterium]
MFLNAAAFARMVKLEHSVFALPFAFIGLFLAAGGWPGWRLVVLLTVAMVSVRTFAMGMNRLLDLDIDRNNPRTSRRPLVTGEITRTQTIIFCVLAAVIFVLACAWMNLVCLWLSPAALLWAGLYSTSKRFTWLCHFWLGSVLGLAPLGGWLAFEPRLVLPAVLFFLGVTFWVAGFDILYSCQDTDFDEQWSLHSAPVRFGLPSAIQLAAFSHVNASLFFGLAGWSAGLGWIYAAAWAVVSLSLAIEHSLVSPADLSRLNTAFFTLNGIVSLILFAGVLTGIFL